MQTQGFENIFSKKASTDYSLKSLITNKDLSELPFKTDKNSSSIRLSNTAFTIIHNGKTAIEMCNDEINIPNRINANNIFTNNLTILDTLTFEDDNINIDIKHLTVLSTLHANKLTSNTLKSITGNFVNLDCNNITATTGTIRTLNVSTLSSINDDLYIRGNEIHIGNSESDIYIAGSLHNTSIINSIVNNKLLYLNLKDDSTGIDNGENSGIIIKGREGHDGYIITNNDATKFLIKAPATQEEYTIGLIDHNNNFIHDGDIKCNMITSISGVVTTDFITSNITCSKVLDVNNLIGNNITINGMLTTQTVKIDILTVTSELNTVTINSNFINTNNIDILNKLSCNNITISNNLYSTNDILSNNITTLYNIYSNNDIFINGNITCNNILSDDSACITDITVNSVLTVNNNATIKDTLTIGSILNVANNTIVNNHITVLSNIYANKANLDNIMSINVTTFALISDNILVNNICNVTNNINVDNNLIVGDTITIINECTVTSNITANVVYVKEIYYIDEEGSSITSFTNIFDSIDSIINTKQDKTQELDNILNNFSCPDLFFPTVNIIPWIDDYKLLETYFDSSINTTVQKMKFGVYGNASFDDNSVPCDIYKLNIQNINKNSDVIMKFLIKKVSDVDDINNLVINIFYDDDINRDYIKQIVLNNTYLTLDEYVQVNIEFNTNDKDDIYMIFGDYYDIKSNDINAIAKYTQSKGDIYIYDFKIFNARTTTELNTNLNISKNFICDANMTVLSDLTVNGVVNVLTINSTTINTDNISVQVMTVNNILNVDTLIVTNAIEINNLTLNTSIFIKDNITIGNDFTVKNLYTNNINPIDNNFPLHIKGRTINIGDENSVINIYGETNKILSTNVLIKDKIITLNDYTSPDSTNVGANSGFEIKGSVSNGYIKTNNLGTRFLIKAPNEETEKYIATLDDNNNFYVSNNTYLYNNVYIKNIYISNNTTIDNITIVSNMNVDLLYGNTIEITKCSIMLDCVANNITTNTMHCMDNIIFNILPVVTDTTVITDNSLVYKKYVDDKITDVFYNINNYTQAVTYYEDVTYNNINILVNATVQGMLYSNDAIFDNITVNNILTVLNNIESDNITATNIICYNNMTLNNLFTTSITSNTLFVEDLWCTTLTCLMDTVCNTATIDKLECKDIIADNITVANNLYIDNNSIIGSCTVSGNLNVIGDAILNNITVNNLFVAGNTFINKQLSVNTLKINDNTVIKNNITVHSSLDIKGTGTFNNLTCTDLTTDILNVSSNCYFNILTIGTALNIDGDLKINTLTILSDLNINNTLTVENINVDILSANSIINVDNNIFVIGKATIENCHLNGDISINNNIVCNNIDSSDIVCTNINITGLSVSDTIIINGNFTITNNLNVLGTSFLENLELNNNLTSVGNINVINLCVFENMLVDNTHTVNGILNTHNIITKNLTTNNIICNNDIIVSGIITANSIVVNNFTSNKNLNVIEDSYFKNIICTGNISTHALISSGNIDVNTLHANNFINVMSDLLVNGNTTILSILSCDKIDIKNITSSSLVTDKLTVSSTATFYDIIKVNSIDVSGIIDVTNITVNAKADINNIDASNIIATDNITVTNKLVVRNMATLTQINTTNITVNNSLNVSGNMISKSMIETDTLNVKNLNVYNNIVCTGLKASSLYDSLPNNSLYFTADTGNVMIKHVENVATA